MSDRPVPELPPADSDLRDHVEKAEAAPLEPQTISAIAVWRRACEIRALQDPQALQRALTSLSVREIGALVAICADSLPVVQAAANWMTVRVIRRDEPLAIHAAETALETVTYPTLDQATRVLLRMRAS